MKSWTVTWDVAAYDDLAEAWTNAMNRAAVSKAADRIDEILSRNPASSGSELHEGLRQIMIGILRVTFEVRSELGRVDVLRVRLAETRPINGKPPEGV